VFAVTLFTWTWTCLGAGRIVFIDDFDKNNNNWYVNSEGDSPAEITNGKYILSRNAVAGVTWNYISLPALSDVEDYEIDVTMGFVRGNPEFECGFLWGLRDRSAHYFEMTGNGRYTYGTLMADRWFNFEEWRESPAVNKTGLNRITIRKTGDSIEYNINSTPAGKHGTVPFFGNQIGFLRRAGTTLEVDRLTVSTTSSAIPDGITVSNNGNFANSAIWPDPAIPDVFQVQVDKGSDMSVSRQLDTDSFVVSALIKQANPASGSVPGLFLRTDDNGLIRLEIIGDGKTSKLRFSASAGGRAMGQKDVDLPSGDALLRITRRGESFSGEAMVAGQTVSVGGLEWRLLKRQVAGLLFQYKTPTIDAPLTVSASFDVQEFTFSKPLPVVP
jgi:hypothetical protein